MLENEIEKAVKSVKDELIDAFYEMPQAKTPYMLRHLIIGQHDTIEMQYAHSVLNLRQAYNALRTAQIGLEKTDWEIGELKKKAGKGDKRSEFKHRNKEVEKMEAECSVIGKVREFQTLYEIWRSFPKKFTREETNAGQEEYWKKRAIRQKNQDLIANGRVGAGNQDLLRQLDMPVAPTIDHIREVEQRFIETTKGNKLMIAVPIEKDIPVEEQENYKLPCTQGLVIPAYLDYGGVYLAHGRTTAENYNEIARVFLETGGDYLLTIEDDTFPPPDALVKLMEHMKEGKKVVGAWYPQRDAGGDGVPITTGSDGKRTYLPADGEMHEVLTIPMGCTLYSKEVFFKVEQPFFARTGVLSQDSFFSQKLRDAGYTLYCDTSIRCKHIDRVTSKVYE